MNIIPGQITLLTPVNNDLLRQIEQIGRVCYRSEDAITLTSYSKFIRMLINRGHEAMLEHASISIQFQCDRGVTHEIVRHRVASYGQESTRYCNYSKDKFGNSITYIDIASGMALDSIHYTEEQMGNIIQIWMQACEAAENYYMAMIKEGASPQIARSVLNNSTATHINVTMNLREWRHFLKLRCAPEAHPQMREVAYQVLQLFRDRIPELVEDITYIVSKEANE